MTISVAIIATLVIGAAGCGGSDEPSAADRTSAGIVRYRSGLEEELGTTAGWIARLANEVGFDRKLQAASRYVSSRVPWGHVKPVMPFFPGLNVLIDAPVAERRPGHLTGFPEVERLLWTWNDSSQAARRAEVRRLFLMLKRVQEEVHTAKLDPTQIATNINVIMSSTVSSAMNGETDPHSGIELIDVSADIEGVQAAYEAIEPLVEEERPGLARRTRDAFPPIYAAIRNAGGIPARDPDQPRVTSPGVSFYVYSDVDPARLRELLVEIDELNIYLTELPHVVEAALKES